MINWALLQIIRAPWLWRRRWRQNCLGPTTSNTPAKNDCIIIIWTFASQSLSNVLRILSIKLKLLIFAPKHQISRNSRTVLYFMWLEYRKNCHTIDIIITFRVMHSRSERYIGHGRLCVWQSVPRRIPTLLHGPVCRRCPLYSCALLGGFAIATRISLL